jgi:membrane fusion protein (multidrug efflux system)
VVQRIPVRIALDAADNSTIELRPGMSVIPTIATRSPVARPVTAAASRTSTKISGAS